VAQDYDVTGVTYSTSSEPDGSYIPIVEVSYTTKTTPAVQGTVTVPAALVPEPRKYAEAVKAAIEAEVAGHKAVLAL